MFFFYEFMFIVIYVVVDLVINVCVIIDLVMDYDVVLGILFSEFVDKIVSFIDKNGLNIEWILEIYVYVDYFMVVFYLKVKLGGLIGIGEYIWWV